MDVWIAVLTLRTYIFKLSFLSLPLNTTPMRMKKTILLALLSLFAVNLASAQAKHTTMLETTRDTLHPEIIEDLLGGVYKHFNHPTSLYGIP